MANHHSRIWIRLLAPLRSRIIADYHAANLASAHLTITALVRDGWHIGPAPYGYRPERVQTRLPGNHPRYCVKLVIEPGEAAVVELMFFWRAHAGLGIAAIVAALNRRDLRHTPFHQAANAPRMWTPARVNAVLNHPVYTGRTVWGRTHRRRPAPPAEWIISEPGAQPAIVDDTTFALARTRPRTGRGSAIGSARTRT